MRLKTMETSSQNYNPSSTTGTTPCITYKHNFSNFQKLLCLPFLNDVHHKLNLVEKETVGKTRHEVSVPYCYLYCKEVAECLDTIFFFFLEYNDVKAKTILLKTSLQSNEKLCINHFYLRRQH